MVEGTVLDPDGTVRYIYEQDELYSIADFDFGTHTQREVGNHFKLCWSHEPTDDITEFKFTVDPDFEVIGPDPLSFTCTLGLPCEKNRDGLQAPDHE
jgi:hypothetical protein